MWQSVQMLFYHYYMKQRLQQHRAQHKTITLQDANSIGILFDATKEENAVWVRRFASELEKQKKHVNLLGFINSANAQEQTAYPSFSRKEVTWYLQPAHHIPNDFLEKPFDILINACITELATLEYIATFSNAKFRIAPYFENKTHCADLFICLKNTDALPDFLRKTLHYLQMIKTR